MGTPNMGFLLDRDANETDFMKEKQLTASERA